MRRSKPKVGDVVQLKLPSDCYAYGRVLHEASVAFYRKTTTERDDRRLATATISS